MTEKERAQRNFKVAPGHKIVVRKPVSGSEALNREFLSLDDMDRYMLQWNLLKSEEGT